jgi:hypothetical protein
MKSMRLLIADPWIRRCLALIQATVLILLSASVVAQKSPVGVHCPTAKVQNVQQVTVQRNCCGKLETKVISRAPKLGEKDFKQCYCAERKSSEREAEKETQVTESQRFVFLPIQAMAIAFAAIPAPTERVSTLDIPFTSRADAPLLPPPNFI